MTNNKENILTINAIKTDNGYYITEKGLLKIKEGVINIKKIKTNPEKKITRAELIDI